MCGHRCTLRVTHTPGPSAALEKPLRTVLVNVTSDTDSTRKTLGSDESYTMLVEAPTIVISATTV